MIQKSRMRFGVFSSFVKKDGGAARVAAILGIAAVFVVASVLAFAGSGNAAGKNICTVPGAHASCVTVRSAPHFSTLANAQSTTAGPVSITKFLNQAGNGGSTATHVVVLTHFDPAVNIVSILFNGSPAPAGVCTTTQTGLATDVSCSAGNISGGGSVKVTVRYTTTASATITGTASYGESKPSGQPSNAVQQNSDSFVVSTDGSAQGGCFDTGTPTLTGALLGQTTETTVVQAQGDLPCTYADAGVLPNNSDNVANGNVRTQISFFEFPTVPDSGYAIVKMVLPSLPAGVKLNTAIVREDTNYAAPFFQTWVTVPNCTKAGKIPNPVGIPAKGDTDSTPNHNNDLCIFDRSPRPGGGAEFDFFSIGSPPDGHVGV